MRDMVTARPFRAIRPVGNEEAKRVAALPYDVMSSDEARGMAAGNPDSFLHVDKAEIDLDPSVGVYDDRVYEKARENLVGLRSRGMLTQDADACFFVYRLTMGGRAQTGLVGCASVDDYMEGRIKKHELTRADKEEDRVRHVDRLNANTGPIFLAHRPTAVDGVVSLWAAEHAPVYDFTADGGVRHTVWKIDAPEVVEEIARAFSERPDMVLYIADGHHRCASAVRVAKTRREQHPGYTGAEEFNAFLAVIFPSDQLAIMDYNRVVKDLNGLTPEAFLEAVSERFLVSPQGAGDVGRYAGASGAGAGVAGRDAGGTGAGAGRRQDADVGSGVSRRQDAGGAGQDAGAAAFRPTEKHMFGMYLNGHWHTLTARAEYIREADPVASLDAVVLQDNLLGPTLGVADPRTDSRIDFVGGIRGLGELERRVDALTAGGNFAVAFAVYPVSMDDLFSVADAGLIMPPKSTWFEPKLLSGLFIHEL